MDCEKFEAAMMDELYGELDELTSAAMKRHSSGCARCASLLDGLRATRKLVAGSTVDVPSGLEARVLDAANEAQKVVPLRRRLALAVSVAGSWAMRPQSAMAAVFMVMLGTSLLLLRGRSSRAPASAEVTVTQHGTPAPAAQAAADMPVASAVAPPFARPPEPKPGALAAQAPGGFAPLPPSPAPAEGLPQDDQRMAKAAARSAAPARDDEGANPWASNAAPAAGGAGFAAPPAAPAAAAPMAAGAGGAADMAHSRKAEQAPSAFDTALRLYQSGRYDEAAKAFDALSPQDPNAELYAARSVRESKGCTRGVAARFDRVAQRANGTPTGWDALLEGALCYRSLGDFASARVRLTPLLAVDSHKDRARSELDRLGADQPRAAAAPAGKAQPVARPAAATPASPPADVGGQ